MDLKVIKVLIVRIEEIGGFGGMREKNEGFLAFTTKDTAIQIENPG